jgi:uncharacterized repeat protein (TIGR01451 family)
VPWNDQRYVLLRRADIRTLIKAPNLQITKDVDKSHANLGDTVTYTTTVTNPQRTGAELTQLGPTDTAINLVVSDEVPSGLHFVRFTVNPGGVCSYEVASREIRCNVGRLAADERFSYSFEATVNTVAAGDSETELPNHACFEANSEDQPDIPFTGCAPAVVIVPPAPPGHLPADLGVVKTVDHEIVGPGDTLTWHIVSTNHGPATSTGFTLADQLPHDVEFVSATHSPELTCTTPPVGSSGAITCTAASPVPATPAAGSSLTLTITAKVLSTTTDGTLLLNVATVSGDQPEPEPDPNPNRDETLARVIVPNHPVPPPVEPDPDPQDPSDPPPAPPQPPVHPPPLPPGPAGTYLALIKTSSPRVVHPGQAISYTLHVTNPGEAEALDVRVCDTPPLGVTITSAPGFHRLGSSICTTIPSLLPLTGSRTFHLTATANPGTRGTVVNHATASARNAATVRASAPNVVPAPPPPGSYARPPAHEPPTKPPTVQPPPTVHPPPPKPPSSGIGRG